MTGSSSIKLELWTGREMGCGNSKNQIHVVSTGTTVDNTKTGVTLKNNDKSLNDTRGGSASSKASKHSCDSGFDDDGYNKVITESSKPEKIKQIEELFKTPRDLGKCSYCHCVCVFIALFLNVDFMTMVLPLRLTKRLLLILGL